MVEKATRWDAEAHTNLRAMLRIIQAITASTVEDELAQLEDQHSSFRKFADNYGFVFGYREVLQASLNSLMEPLIGQPTAFGYEAEADLQKWFFAREGGTQAVPVVTESSDNDLANILAIINGLMAGCRKAGNHWGNLTKVMQDIQGFTQTVLATLPEYQVVSKQTDVSTTARASDIIKQRAADWLAGPLWDGRAISNAVEFINPGGSRHPIDIYWD